MGSRIKNSVIEIALEIRVPFYDCDSLGIVWHGNYIKYFEQARCALLDKIDYNYNQMQESGFGWPIIKTNTKHVRPAVFNQDIVVHAGLIEFEHQLTVKFEIVDKASEAILCKGETIQVAINMATQQTCFISPKILFDKLGVAYEG